VAAPWVAYAIAGGVAVVTAIAGMRLTRLDSWFRELRKPSWQPPDWAFGPAWTTIFSLAVWSAGRSWNAADADFRMLLLGAFLFNVVLNIAWSWLFFTSQRIDWALLEVGPLWLSIALLMVLTAQVDTLSPWLLLPYLLWVSFAAFLNRRLWQLNRP